MVVAAPSNCHLRWDTSLTAAVLDGRDVASRVATTTRSRFAACGANTCQRHLCSRGASSKGLMVITSHVPFGMGVGTSSLPHGLSALSRRGIATRHDSPLHLLAGSRAPDACLVPRVMPTAACRWCCRQGSPPSEPPPWSAVSSTYERQTGWSRTEQRRRTGRGGRERREGGGGVGAHIPVHECWRQLSVWGDKSSSSPGPAVGIAIMAVRSRDRGLSPANTNGFQDGSPVSRPGRETSWLARGSGARLRYGSGFSGEVKNRNCPSAVAGDGNHANVQADGVDPGRTVDGIANAHGAVGVSDGATRTVIGSEDGAGVCDGLAGDGFSPGNPISKTELSPPGSSFAGPGPVPVPPTAAAVAGAAAFAQASPYTFPDRPTDPRLRAIEDCIEKTIFDFRFFTLLAVLGSLAGSVLCFAKGCYFIIRGFKEYYITCLSGVHTGKVILLLIEAVDVFLVGTVMLIFGMGLYELFITNVPVTVPLNMDRALNTSTLFGMFRLRERPRWMKIQTLDELKTKLGHVIVMILLVNMFEKAKMVEVASASDLVLFSLSVLMSAGSLYLLNRLHQ